MKKRKLAAILTTMALGASVLSGCSKNDDKKDNKVDETKAEITVTEEVGTEEKVEDKYSIVCTTFPQYDWAKEVIGDKIDNYELTLLLDNGVDLHSYQPTVDDIKKIGRNKVHVPTGFFKVVLAKGKKPKAIGYIFENRRGSQGRVCTVDEIEDLTGMDFFSPLDDKIEEQVEAYANIRQW